MLKLAFGIAALGAATGAHAQVGGCQFDRATLQFAGTSAQQATCLLRKVEIGARLRAQTNPPSLLARVGTALPFGSINLDAALSALPAADRAQLIANARRGVSRTASGAPAAYFVIHDTSSPYFRDQPFPADIDSSATVNGLTGYLGAKAVAHVFINRMGTLATGHDFSVPWRATRLESKVIGKVSRGRFLHVELVQPRRRDPAVANPKNDRFAPEPGFTPAQYRALAAAYVTASVRARRWLLPGFHAAIDDGVSGAHDDPQNFDVAQFEQAVALIAGPRSGASVAPPAPIAPLVGRWGNRPPRDQWTVMAFEAVDQLGPRLWAPSFTPSDIETYCPRYRSLDPVGRKMFWAALLSSLAKPESNFNPDETFTEGFKDAQGRPVISRGLLQISIESGNGYGCGLTNALQLHDPRTNLRCAVRILDRQVPRGGVIAGQREGKWIGAASYWSPFRKADRRADVAGWVATQPLCAA